MPTNPPRSMTFEVDGVPATMGSFIPFISETTGRACLKPYKADELRAWQEQVRCAAKIEAIRVSWGTPRKCAMSIVVECYLPRPYRHYREQGDLSPSELRPSAPAYPINARGPDEDKHLRAVQDATEGIIVDKDGRYVDGRCVQRYADGRLPGAVIRVATMGG